MHPENHHMSYSTKMKEKTMKKEAWSPGNNGSNTGKRSRKVGDSEKRSLVPQKRAAVQTREGGEKLWEGASN